MWVSTDGNKVQKQSESHVGPGLVGQWPSHVAVKYLYLAAACLPAAPVL